MLDSNDKLKGIATRDGLAALVNRGDGDCTKCHLDAAMTTDVDTLIENLISMAAQSERPIAVTDDEGRLLGEIHRGALLAGMAGSSQ